MPTAPQNTTKKTQENPNISGTDKNSDRNSTQQKDANKPADAYKAGGMKNDPQSSDTRREREEEDRPRAGNKVGNK